MNRKLNYLFSLRIYGLLLTLALIVFIGLTFSYKLPPPSYQGISKPIKGVTLSINGGAETETKLPVKLTGLPARTPVTLYAKIDLQPYDTLQIKSVFSPMVLYIDDEEAFRCGQEGSYPSFFNDPPTIISMAPLPPDKESINLRVEYLSPSQRSTISLPGLFIGSEGAILKSQYRTNGFSLLFSFILIFTGFYMVLVFFTLSKKVPSGLSFLWLGLFSLSVGFWVFGECDLTALLLPRHSLLYILDYLGLFTVAIPFLKFGLIVLNPSNKLAIRIMLLTHYMALAATIFLQFIGKVDFIKSLFIFHILVPLAFALFAVCLIVESIRYKNPAAKRFGSASVFLAIAALLELANYWLSLTSTLTIFFQLGVLAFVISLGVASGQYVRESVFTKAEKRRLEYEMEATAKQLSLQRQQYTQLSDNQAAIKAQRHDMRHQLVLISGLLNKGEYKKLRSYIDTLIVNIPGENERPLTENFAVNAVASYYFNLASEAGIEVSVDLAVPLQLDGNTESDLCIIIGNLFENAIEACGRMDEGRQFIRIASRLQYDTLTITADNSYNREVRRKSDLFLSSKRDGEGIGTSSVKAVAQRLGGNARFETENGVFKASVYIKIY